ncbi:MAG: hypothetical protein AABY18_07730 [Candidatus Thermoplasmatota archaeon]
MPFTAHDTPAIVSRIGGDLLLIEATLRRGDPHLRALILTGGFARGEGGVRDGAPQNDYDLVAVRGFGPPRVPYARMRADLEKRLGLHVDLATVAAWRLPRVGRSVFWYETALRGRVLWGEDLLGRVPVRDPKDLDPREGLRLLANRAAGLLLATEAASEDAVRLQAAKALLASFDAELLAAGHFAPSQRERWVLFQGLLATHKVAPRLLPTVRAWQWAYRFKLDPATASTRNAAEAWRTARRAILAAVPAALAHAKMGSLHAYGRGDGIADRIVYALRVHAVPGARRFVAHPTGGVRVATLRLLEASVDGQVQVADARRCMAGIARPGALPLRTLEGLRAATLQ